MAVMLTNLARYLGMYTNAQDTQLNDKSEMSSWASDSVNFVLQNKIMQGTGNNRFSPKTRTDIHHNVQNAEHETIRR